MSPIAHLAVGFFTLGLLIPVLAWPPSAPLLVIPVVLFHGVVAVSHSIRGLQLGPWDWNLWDLAYWYREP